MAEYEEMAAVIDSCHSVLLREISEPEQNALRLLLIEGIVSAEPKSLNFGGTSIGDAYPVEFLPESQVFEITWNLYVAYAITNESYSISDIAPHSGRWLRRYSDSPFLDYVRRSTCASDEYPGPLVHLAVVSEMHIVDVVSTRMPTVNVTHLSDDPFTISSGPRAYVKH